MLCHLEIDMGSRAHMNLIRLDLNFSVRNLNVNVHYGFKTRASLSQNTLSELWALFIIYI